MCPCPCPCLCILSSSSSSSSIYLVLGRCCLPRLSPSPPGQSRPIYSRTCGPLPAWLVSRRARVQYCRAHLIPITTCSKLGWPCAVIPPSTAVRCRDLQPAAPSSQLLVPKLPAPRFPAAALAARRASIDFGSPHELSSIPAPGARRGSEVQILRACRCSSSWLTGVRKGLLPCPGIRHQGHSHLDTLTILTPLTTLDLMSLNLA